jgi:hypothetical protein
MTLEQILQEYFGCSKPFLKKKRVVERDQYGEVSSCESFTKAGIKAYNELICLVSDLGTLFGKGFHADHWIGELDEISNLDE